MATVNLFSGTLIIIIQYSIYNYDKQIELPECMQIVIISHKRITFPIRLLGTAVPSAV